MLTPAVGGATGGTAAVGCAVKWLQLQMRPDGDEQAATDEVITHEEVTAADWP